METLPLPARRHRPHHMQFIASIELVISSIPHYAFPGPRVSSLLLRCCCCCCYYFYYYYYRVQVSHDEYRLDIETVLVSTVCILFSFLFLFLFFFLFSLQKVSTLLYVIKCMESRFDAYFEPRRFFLPPRVCVMVL